MKMRIGIITALAEEMMPIYGKLGNVAAETVIHGVRIRHIKLGADSIYLATGGVGEVNAALTLQMLVDMFDIEVALNFGFVGTLNPAIGIGELVIADRVCHYQFDTSQIDGTKPGQYLDNDDIYFYLDGSLVEKTLAAIGKPIKRVAVASGDVFVADGATKRRLADEFGCDICEMELAGLAIACNRNGIPLLSVKAVSDRADDGAPVSFDEALAKGLSRYDEILPAVIAAVTGKTSPLPPVKNR